MFGWLVVMVSARLMAFMKLAGISSQSLKSVGRERRSMEKGKRKKMYEEKLDK